MSIKKFSEISVEYALHINHIQKARDIFEKECNSFMNEISGYLYKKLEELYSRDCKLYLETDDRLKVAPSGHAKSYYSMYKCPIKIKSGRSKSSRYETLGYFQTGIEFDNHAQAFLWTIKFHNNEEVLDPRLDENVFSNIKASQGEQENVFINPEQINFDGLYFHKQPIDENFNFDFKKTIDTSISILLSTIANSENFLKTLGKSEHNKIMKIAAG